MTTITLVLDDQAINKIQAALVGLHEGQTIQEWLEHELNNNTDVIIEMLLGDM